MSDLSKLTNAELAQAMFVQAGNNDILANALLREAASRLQAPAVAEVEALEWNEYDRGDGPEEWDAETKFGTFYQIDIGMNGFRWTHDLEGGGTDLDSLDDAKAAAQADYAVRIRSALRTGSSE